MNSKQSWNIIAGFLLLIFGMTAATLLKPDTAVSESENRDLAQMPAFSLESLLEGEFTADYETYLTDQFILRDQWIRLRTGVERLALRQEVNGVYFAKDGYLIETHSGTFGTQQAEANISSLASFCDLVAREHPACRLTVMVVPNALELLKEKLPPFASAKEEETYLERLRAALPQDVWFDAGEALRPHSGEPIFYRTDHHWTTLGAFYACAAWMESQGFPAPAKEDYTVTAVTDTFRGTVAAKVGIKVPGDTIEKYEPLRPVPYLLTYNQSDDVRSTVYQNSALDTRSQYNYFYGGNYGLIEAETQAGSGRRLLVIKDSYAHCFVPFTYQQFDEVDMLDLRYFNQSLSDYIDAGNYTDILFLYNASGFAEDVSLAKLLV